MELRRHDRRPIKKNEKRPGAYYALCSRRAGFAKWAVVILLAVFLTVMLAVFHSNITTDNLKYLLRDFSSDRSGISSDFKNVVYENQSAFDALIFKGELAMIGSSDAALFNSSGEVTFDYGSDMENPVAQATEKYLFAYDLGGTHYSVFSNLTRVLDAHADAVIENASMSDKGSFILVKRAKDAKYTVSVYDSSFKNRVNYYKSRFVSDAAISPDGKRIAVVTVGNTGAKLSSLLELYDFGAQEPSVCVTGAGYLPICLRYFEDGSFALVCDDRVLFFDPGGAETASCIYDERRPVCMDAGAASLCVVYSGDSAGEATLTVFDSRGNVEYEVKTDQKISDVSHNDKYVFALGAGSVHRFDRSDNTVESEKCDADMKSIVASDYFAIALSSNCAKCVFGEKDENQTDLVTEAQTDPVSRTEAEKQ